MENTFACGICGKEFNTVLERAMHEIACVQNPKVNIVEKPEDKKIKVCKRCGYIEYKPVGDYEINRCCRCYDWVSEHGDNNNLVEIDLTIKEYRRNVGMSTSDLSSFAHMSDLLHAFNREVYDKYIEPLGTVDKNCDEYIYEQYHLYRRGDEKASDEACRKFLDRWNDHWDNNNSAPLSGKSLYAEPDKPKCPTCGSTNIHSIDGFERWASVFVLGLFSKKVGKSFECLNCRYTW